MPPTPRGVSKRDQQVRNAVGANIRRLRLARGVTLEVLAASIEVSTATMGKIETGKQAISTDILQRLSIALDAKLSTLVRQSDKERRSA